MILNRQTAAETLLSFKGATIISFVAQTKVSKISAKSKFKDTYKVAICQAIIGTDYLNKILREQKKQENEVGYTLSERTNGLQKEGKCLSSNEKGEVYLDVVNIKIIDSKHYYPNNDELSSAEVEDMYRHHMIPSYYTGLSTLAQRQGVEEVIRFNSYKFDNIKNITWGGQDYILEGQATLKKENYLQDTLDAMYERREKYLLNEKPD